MREKERRKFLLPLNIQLFADGDGDGGDGGSPKTYSEEEYKKVQDELAKMKASFDKTSSELAAEKKKAKEKLSEEEKKRLEGEEKEKQFAEMQKELKQMKLSKNLSKVFTDEGECEAIAKAFMDDDIDKVIELIGKSHENFKKKVEEEAKSKFSKSAKVPGAADHNGDGDDSKIAELAKKKSTKVETNDDKWNKFKNR